MKNKDFAVRVYAHKGKLFIYPNCHRPVGKLFYPTNAEGNMGCVLCKTKGHLEISKEAIALMGKVRRNNDAIGDLGWWKCVNGDVAFSWFGAIYRIVDPATAQGDRDFRVHEGSYKEIPNDVPEEILKYDNALEKESSMWRAPFYHEAKPRQAGV